ncbi:MAG: Heat shock protein 60 family co-chaperone GroES, partial [uncultured Rubrobacteraceae bacterium]
EIQAAWREGVGKARRARADDGIRDRASRYGQGEAADGGGRRGRPVRERRPGRRGRRHCLRQVLGDRDHARRRGLHDPRRRRHPRGSREL